MKKNRLEVSDIMNIKKSPLFYPYLVGVVLLVIDFITKVIANLYLPFQESVKTFLPFLLLYRTHNTGYHYLLGEIGNHKLWAILGIVLVSFLIYSISHSLVKEPKSKADRKILSTLISLMIGATGNVLEVLFLKRATDFFIFHPFPWPSNISDQYINAILYIILPIIIIKSIFDWKRHRENKLSEDTKPSEVSKSSEG